MARTRARGRAITVPQLPECAGWTAMDKNKRQRAQLLDGAFARSKSVLARELVYDALDFGELFVFLLRRA